MRTIYRILDAQINRGVEALRVLEDFFRFCYDDKILSASLRELRHQLRKIFMAYQNQLLSQRDSGGDVGLATSKSTTLDKRDDSASLMVANFKRAQEAMRGIEESAKALSFYQEAKQIEQLRFTLYNKEKEAQLFLKPTLPLGLYAITDEKFSKGRDAIYQVKELCKAKIPIIQYREKYKTKQEKLKIAKEIRKITKEAGTLLVINDDIDIALEVEADGLHLGQDDLPIDVAKRLLPPSVFVGLSTHSINDYNGARLANADYVGVGPIFLTQTKENVCAPVGLSYVKEVMQNPVVPFCAIGGIKLHNIDEVLDLGVKRVAIVSEVVAADDICAMASRLHNHILDYVISNQKEIL